MDANSVDAPHVTELEAEFQKNLRRLIGKTFYKVWLTKLINVDTSIEDIDKVTLGDTLTKYKVIDRRVKNLTPMRVVDGKYYQLHDLFLIMVELPNGDHKLLKGSAISYANNKNLKKASFLSKMDIEVLDKTSTRLTARELLAVKDSEIFIGMSENALRMAWGVPEKTNDLGRMGEQHVFVEKYFVYTRNGRIFDYQLFE